MDSFLDNIKNWTRDKTEHVKETIHNLTTTTSISIDDLATIILLHPHTQYKKKEYLGLIFNECTLSIDTYEYYLETKGDKHEHILELTVKEGNEVLSSYHSYKDKKHKMKVPESIMKINDIQIH